ncbi:MAG: hypothetical protein V3R49_04805, partial [Gammaproteobacteria bacterium]
ILIAIPASLTWADDTTDAGANNQIKEQQQKLQQILEEIGGSRKQRTQQRARLEKLNKKMECNWALIKNYDVCDKEYNEQKQEQLNCVQEAKTKATKCLSSINDL